MLKRNSGFTLIELIFIIVCIGVLAYFAIPKFIDISGETGRAAEDEMVGKIKTGLQLYGAEYMVNNGQASYPPELDDASAGQSSTENRFFTNVLQEPYGGSNWQKENGTVYIGPTGTRYVYDNSSGAFTMQID